MSARDVQTGFEFDDWTEVTREDEGALIETIADSISRLRDQIDDVGLDGVFTSDPGSDIRVRGAHSRPRSNRSHKIGPSYRTAGNDTRIQ